MCNRLVLLQLAKASAVIRRGLPVVDQKLVVRWWRYGAKDGASRMML